jgi:hypothetical protein
MDGKMIARNSRSVGAGLLACSELTVGVKGAQAHLVQEKENRRSLVVSSENEWFRPGFMAGEMG